jgi:hypothetical protein
MQGLAVPNRAALPKGSAKVNLMQGLAVTNLESLPKGSAKVN